MTRIRVCRGRLRLFTAGALALSSVLCFAGPPAHAQRLTIQGDRFAVDGAPRFLTFVSYFGAMGADDVTADLQFIKDVGFDGVRIWPNIQYGPQLMESDGGLNQSNLTRLRFILDRARERGLIVDVTFTAQQVDGLSADGFRSAIVATTAALVDYDNLLFDIQNERNIYGPFGRPLTAADVAAIAGAIKRAHPDRIVTASNSQNESASFAAEFTKQTGLDVTAYHDPRVSSWYQWKDVRVIVATLRANEKPAYLQEPTRSPFLSTDRADYFREARANAKRAGAAAWCFHTDLAFDLRGSGTRFQTRLQSSDQPEWSFVSSLIPFITLRASSGSHYVVAEGGGGGAVFADRQTAGDWATFRVSALNGGPLMSGDAVTFRTADDHHYLEAASGGGGAVVATAEREGPLAIFVIEKQGAGPIASGDSITLRTATDPAWYVTAERGGGGAVNVDRRVPGSWETFTITMVNRTPLP